MSNYIKAMEDNQNPIAENKKRIGIVNVNLQYEIPENKDAEDYLCNVELPKEYVTDSFNIVKIIKE